MKIAKGNEKLGDCLVISRPVGLTCPTSCFFLGNGCYAEKTEKRFPNAREAAQSNVRVNYKDIISLIEQAIGMGKSIRIHERGDWGRGNRVDMQYVNAWRRALSSFVELPRIWFYTHFYSKHLAALGNFPNVSAYASVHNETDIKRAKRAGFTLFAYITEHKKDKGGSKDFAKVLDLPILGPTVVCPEQRRGRTEVTCVGTKDTIACNLCTFTNRNVAFLAH